MDNSVQITESEKNDLYNKLSGILIPAIDAGAIDFETSQEASEYILVNLEDVKDKDDLLFFMQRLIEQWPIFQGSDIVYKVQEAQVIDQQKIQEAREQLQQVQ